MNLITWNIQRGRGPDGRCSMARTLADLQRIADADVLCLQEVSAGHTDLAGCDGGNQFVELAQRASGFAPVAAIASDTLGENGARRLFGCMILSRCPVLQVVRHALPWPPDPDVMSMQRIALEVTLDTPLGHVRVTTTHLEYFSRVQRAAQVERLRELHCEAAQHARHPRPGDAGAGPFSATPRAHKAILAGDFNFAPDCAEYRRLQAPFHDATPAYRDAWALLHGDVSHPATVCLHDKPGRPAAPVVSDFLFVSKDLAHQVRRIDVVSDDLGPDHQPLLLQLA